ncbi:MAG: Maf family protein [Erysipelotrichaceae bacterium]
MQRLILASKSPRRRELMDLLKIPYEVIVSEADEVIDKNNDLRKEIEHLAYKKAETVFMNNRDAVVIGADTIVVINNEVLGKPMDEEDARRMLRMLSNNVHEVITGVCILSEGKIDNFSCVTKVYFNEMSEEEIDEYVSSSEPKDKAGSYAIQGLGAKYIRGIEGDYYTVMGLPISEVYKRLKSF